MFASLVTYPGSAFNHFVQLRREMDAFLESAAFPSSNRSITQATLPAINVGRTSTTIEVYAFVPGLDPSKIDVSLDRGVLHISGERAPGIPETESRVQILVQERNVGKFSRTISLPDDIDPSQVNASYSDGVLQITIGRREAIQPKRITVQ